MLNPGVVLNGRYRLEKHLATGGMSEVWRATDTTLGRTVAVKVLLPNLLSDPGFAARFRAEAMTLASLRHPGVVDIFDSGEERLSEGRRVLYLVMEYVAGEPLSRRIARVGRLDPRETLSLVAQAAEALHAAHGKGIVHRDVKPSNLLIKANGTVKLVDFGVARSAAASNLTGTNAIVGTALYMAPEQARGLPVSAATDVYALGAVAYHCLAGRPPFPGTNPVEVAVRHLNDVPAPLPADVPPAVAQVVKRALAKDPADRYPNAAALAADARAVLAGRPPAARRTKVAVREAPAARTRTLTTVGHRPALSRAGAAARRRAALVAAGMVVVAGLTGALAIAPDADAPTGRAPAPAAPSIAPSPEGRSEPAAGRGDPTPTSSPAGVSARPTRSSSPTPAPTTSRPAPRPTAPTTAPTPTTPPPEPAPSDTSSPPPPPTTDTPTAPTTPPEESEVVPIGNSAAGSAPPGQP